MLQRSVAGATAAVMGSMAMGSPMVAYSANEAKDASPPKPADPNKYIAPPKYDDKDYWQPFVPMNKVYPIPKFLRWEGAKTLSDLAAIWVPIVGLTFFLDRFQYPGTKTPEPGSRVTDPIFNKRDPKAKTVPVVNPDNWKSWTNLD